MLRTLLLAVLLVTPCAAQKVFHTVDEALELAFPQSAAAGDDGAEPTRPPEVTEPEVTEPEVTEPEVTVERTTEVLTEQECDRIAAESDVSAPGRVVFPYVARDRDGEVVGYAYFDLHRVRTLRETVMVVVRPDGTAGRVVVCAFAEPLDYVPQDTFYDQFAGHALDDDLRLRRGIDGVTGATLTCRATTDS